MEDVVARYIIFFYIYMSLLNLLVFGNIMLQTDHKNLVEVKFNQKDISIWVDYFSNFI